MPGLFDPYFSSMPAGEAGGLFAALPGRRMRPNQRVANSFAALPQQGVAPGAMPMPGPMPGSMPAQAQQPQGGFLSRLGSGLSDNSNLLLAMGAGLLSGDGWGGAAQGALAGGELDRRNRDRAATEQGLIAQGVEPAMARLAAGNPAIAASLLSGGKQTGDIQEYEYAKAQGYKGSLSDWIANKRGGAGEYGLQAIWGTGADGKPKIIQLGKSGEAIETKLPEGFQPNKDAQRIDLGTHWGVLDPVTRQLVTTIPKDVAGEAREKEVGKGQGGAQLTIPGVETSIDNALRTIEGLRNHPGLDTGTGASSVFDPRSWVPGTDAYDFNEKNKTAQGQTFLAAREALKGAGQVTDFEGTKGEQAIANLSTAQSKEQYLEALDTVERMVKASLEDLKRKAGIKQPGVPAGVDPEDWQYMTEEERRAWQN